MRKDRTNQLPLHRILLPVATVLFGFCAAILLVSAREPQPGSGSREPAPVDQGTAGEGAEVAAKPEDRPQTEQRNGETAVETASAQETEQGTEQKTGQETEQKTGQKTEQKTGQKTEQKTGQKTEQKTGQKTGQKTEQKTGQETEQKTGQEPGQEAGQKATPAQKAERVLVVTRSEEEAAFLTALVRSLGREPAAVAEEAYRAELLQETAYLVTTSPVCEEAVAGGYPSLCLGEACRSSPSLSLERAETAAVALQLGEYSQGALLEQEVSYIIGHSGRELGKITVGNTQAPFAVRTEQRIDVPFFRASGLGAVMAGEAMAQLFGGGKPGKMYLVLDEIYPFSDLAKLCRMAELLSESGIPFLVRVMPVYDNLDYPAFLRYLQVLRYLQAKDGTVVLHEPVDGPGSGETEPYAGRLQRFRDTLAENGVYERDFTYPPYTLTWREINGIDTTAKNFGTFSVDTMFAVPAELSLQEFQELLDQVNARWLSLSDYKENFTDETYRYREEPIEEIFTYRQETQADMTDFFSRADSILFLAVGAGLLIFGVLLAIGARRYRRKFYR